MKQRFLPEATAEHTVLNIMENVVLERRQAESRKLALEGRHAPY